jgi:hypothetical protein
MVRSRPVALIGIFAASFAVTSLTLPPSGAGGPGRDSAAEAEVADAAFRAAPWFPAPSPAEALQAEARARYRATPWTVPGHF